VPNSNASFPIVGIGASAGGLEAFTKLLNALPVDTGMAFVLIQHLDPQHESALTQILSRATSMPVIEIENGQPVLPNQVHVIPRDTNLMIEQGMLKLAPRPKGRVPHKPIDKFFESLALDQRERAIGVVLSGTASDGTLGLEVIKAEGGLTFAQDDTAKHDSMPRSAVAAGCVDLVLSPADISKELARIARHPYAAALTSSTRAMRADDRVEAAAHEHDATPLPPGDGEAIRGGGGKRTRAGTARAQPQASADGYKKILLLLRNHSGVDFSLYKSTTIQRRINRRMILTRHNSLGTYATFLRGNALELDALYSDVLISVTSFFRNPEMFDALQRSVLPEMLKQRGDGPLRCWVLGCSTGQEAYSIAMAFVEAADKVARARSLQIFATDLNEALLAKARHGLYARSLAEDLTPERLRRFFVEEDGGYRVTKSLREMVVFARQNVISDPPFSRMDLISCRNLLIYLEPSLQKKALPTFHYALKPSGFLLLGASESIGSFTDLFEPVDKKHKIYSRKSAATPAIHLPGPRTQLEPSRRNSPKPAGPRETRALAEFSGGLNAQREADRITINQFSPPGVLVNADLQILQFRGPTGAYLQPPAGQATLDVLKMSREGLMLPLRSALSQAKKTNKAARGAIGVLRQTRSLPPR
jgi:two-component system CheB/CheR fusion protein